MQKKGLLIVLAILFFIQVVNAENNYKGFGGRFNSSFTSGSIQLLIDDSNDCSSPSINTTFNNAINSDGTFAVNVTYSAVYNITYYRQFNVNTTGNFTIVAPCRAFEQELLINISMLDTGDFNKTYDSRYSNLNLTSIVYGLNLTNNNQYSGINLTTISYQNNLTYYNAFASMNLTGIFYTLNSIFINQNITNYNDFTAKNFTNIGYGINTTLNTEITNLNLSLKNSTNVLTDFTICNKILGGLGNFCLLSNYLDLPINTTISSINTTSNIQSLGFLTSQNLNDTYAYKNDTGTIFSINTTNNLRSLLDGTYLLKVYDFSGFVNLTTTLTQIFNSPINFTQKNITFTNGADIIINATQKIYWGNFSVDFINGTDRVSKIL